MEELLDCIVAFINEIRSNSNSPAIKGLGRKLAAVFYQIKREEPGYLQQLDVVFAGDTELYILVLSVLFFLFQEQVFLDKAEELCSGEGLSYEQALGVWKQVGMIRFRKGWEETAYGKRRKIQEQLVKRLKREISFSCGMISSENGSQKKRILMVTDTLLSELHAPTQMVLEMCRTLQEELEYEVLLLVCVEYIPQDIMETIWLYPYHAHYNAKYYRFFEREYRGTTIKGYQQVVSQAHFHELSELFRLIEEWQPALAWYIGGTSVVAELMKDMVPMVSMPCTNGYAVSSAPVLACYLQNDEKCIRQMREYIAQAGQKTVEIKTRLDYTDFGKDFSPEDYGLSGDAFVIAVVGNRLDSELSGEFLEVMRQILEQSDKAAFIIVGKCTKQWKEDPFAGRVINLGFREDLYNVLAGAKLFLNPVRKGGGGGAVCSIKAGVPVVTLGNCDAANVGEEFVCNSLAEFPQIVQRYERDATFYQERSVLCKKRFYQDLQASHGDSCKKLIEVMEGWKREHL